MWNTADAGKLESEINQLTGSELDLDAIKAEGMSVRLGGRIVKLEVTEETMIDEDAIKAELKEKAQTLMNNLRTLINEKVSEFKYMADQAVSDAEEEQRKLQRKLNESNLMPDVTMEHARKGLSVVKGSREADGENVLTWLYQGVYWPKKYDGRDIEAKYSKRLITPVTLEIVTRGNNVLKLVVRQTIGLAKFEHYHGMDRDNDCWGEWSYPKTYNTPDDIINIARTAFAVLENINPMSPANREPRGLPRLSTIERHTAAFGERVSHSAGRSEERTGVAVNDRGEAETIWSAE